MTHRFPVPRLSEQIEQEWAKELATYFGRAEEDVFHQVRPWLSFPNQLVRIELMDGSCLDFKFCIAIVSEEKRAIAVFTEHCGNHVFPCHEAKVYQDGELVWAAPRSGVEILFFKVFGKLIAVVGQPGSWQAFYPGTNGTCRPADFIIPDDVTEDGMAEYLDNLFHEDATPKHSTVERVYP